MSSGASRAFSFTDIDGGRMLYWQILAGLLTFLALCWTWSMLVSDGEGDRASKLERLITAAETAVEEYRYRR